MAGTPRAGIIPVTPFQQNCTLIWSEETKVGAVVDPGGDLDRIEAAIRDQGITVEKILLTHGHIDHAGGADELRERLGVPIEGPHEADRYLLDSLPETGANYGLDGARAVTPDRWLAEGDTVTVGGLTFEILHAPGHSPGSVVFMSRDARFALVGDVVFKGSVGRTDLPGGNHEQLIRAIHEKLLPLGDDVAFIPGHGPTSTLGEERVTNPFLQG
ncbi:MBL fold metallo-hydrolase [Methylobacterium iners]|jgi:glyoxylase-like metal-dependent hydrolase (beta-lactamase superfamily II)|uniref:Hydroxyacylglutathione hydrolase GloC n=1 Tax=Methylobacterium iners TaxID=418707 RepID=A0ABQ4S1H3_9HYPH|nr:MBL fold metallo-hydrolase [Methylobacterium iners]GJD96966.1 Hydroxyacylglutathione hydrolase GloC [Methylobacterium iners]